MIIFAYMKAEKRKKLPYKWHNILLPIAIGVGVTWWIFAEQLGDFSWGEVHMTGRAWWGIALAALMLLGREVGYVCRYRFITNGDLTWMQALKVCVMCEFSSAMTPSSVGGSGLSMVFMHRYGISIGRGTTLMLSTVFFDGLFCVVSRPLVLLFVPWSELVSPLNVDWIMDPGLLIGLIYGSVVAGTVTLFLGIVVWPNWMRALLDRLFRIPLLRRWHGKALELGTNMVNASHELRAQSAGWWLKCIGVTFMSWTCRFLIINALMYAFVDNLDQVLVFARQTVVWLVLIACPTPGGSGVGEWLFSDFYGDMLATGSVAVVVALLWRVFSYYVFLVMGAVVAPLWLRGDSDSNSDDENEQNDK